MIINRRKFVKKTLAAASIAPFFSNNLWSNLNLIEKDIKISLQSVSFANKLMSGEMSILDFPKIPRKKSHMYSKSIPKKCLENIPKMSPKSPKDVLPIS